MIGKTYYLAYLSLYRTWYIHTFPVHKLVLQPLPKDKWVLNSRWWCGRNSVPIQQTHKSDKDKPLPVGLFEAKWRGATFIVPVQWGITWEYCVHTVRTQGYLLNWTQTQNGFNHMEKINK